MLRTGLHTTYGAATATCLRCVVVSPRTMLIGCFIQRARMCGAIAWDCIGMALLITAYTVRIP